MTVVEFNKILESRKFKSTKKGKKEFFIVTFSKSSIFKEYSNPSKNKYMSDYSLIESDNGFRMTFQNTVKGIWSDDFRNVKVVLGNIVEWINIDRYVTNDDYDIILEGL